MFTTIIESAVRGGIQFVVGYLVLKGIIDQEAATAFVASSVTVFVGIVTALGTLAWSVISKKKALATVPPTVTAK